MPEEQDPWGGLQNPSVAQGFLEAPWVKIPVDMLRDRRWTRSHLVVYGELYWRAGRRGFFYEFQGRLAERLGLSLSSVAHAIADLRTDRYIDTDDLGPQFGGALRYVVFARVQTVPQISAEDAEKELHEGMQPFAQPSIRPEKTPEKHPESSGAPPPAPPARRGKKLAKPIDEQEYAKLFEEFEPVFKTHSAVQDLIDDALNYYDAHAEKYTSLYLCVRGSLRRTVERKGAGGSVNGTGQRRMTSTNHMDFRAQDFTIDEAYAVALEKRLDEEERQRAAEEGK